MTNELGWKKSFVTDSAEVWEQQTILDKLSKLEYLEAKKPKRNS